MFEIFSSSSNTFEGDHLCNISTEHHLPKKLESPASLSERNLSTAVSSFSISGESFDDEPFDA